MKTIPFSLLALGAVTLASCGGAASSSERNVVSRTPTQQTQDAAILQRIGIVLPASATVEYSSSERGMDDNARVVLLMPAADWATMQAKPPLNSVPPERYNSDEAMSLGPSDGDWRPADQPGIQGTQVSLPNARYLNVGVAPATEGRVRVYLFWFET